MKLAVLSTVLGIGLALPHAYGLTKPKEFSAACRRFPRSLPWGRALMLLGTAWFLWNVQRENITDFAQYKPVMLAGFGAIGVGACFFVQDFLAVRGLAVVLLLLAKVVLDTARWHDSPWRLLLVVGAYLWILAAMWFIVSPWRLRDLLHWATANDRRLRQICVLRLAVGCLLIALGLFVF